MAAVGTGEGVVFGNGPLVTSWAAGFRSSLRGFARAHLPEAMVPSRFVVLAELPTLPNGKVDRNRLPSPDDDDPGRETVYVAPRNPVEARLAEAWQDILGLPTVGVESDFFNLGGNSLIVMRMAAVVREAFDVRVDLRRFLEEPTIARLARLVSAVGSSVLAGAANRRGLGPEDLRREAVLPDDVVPDTNAAPAAGPHRAILLTGGTGYTGAYLVRELLDRSDAQVLVLVRATSPREAFVRVRRNLESYGVWRDGDEGRLRGVAGDTSKPYLGLDRATYLDVAAGTDAIVHNAADSRWTVPYVQVKPVNVLSTLEVLRLACRDRIKAVHYVSSTGAFPGKLGETVWVEEALPDPVGLFGGYRQSKWVADTLVHTARARGVPASVYRPGILTGAQDTGACTTETFMNHLLRGWVQLGSTMRYDLRVELVPVDYFAAAVAHIALSGAAPDTYHVPGAHTLDMDEIADHMIGYGYPLRPLPYPRWREELVAAIERGEENALAPYLALFGPDRPAEEIGLAGSRPEFDTTRLTAALAGTGIEIRPVDRELMGRYLRYFVDIGYLPPPPDKPAAPVPSSGA